MKVVTRLLQGRVVSQIETHYSTSKESGVEIELGNEDLMLVLKVEEKFDGLVVKLFSDTDENAVYSDNIYFVRGD